MRERERERERDSFIATIILVDCCCCTKEVHTYNVIIWFIDHYQTVCVLCGIIDTRYAKILLLRVLHACDSIPYTLSDVLHVHRYGNQSLRHGM